MTDFDPQIEKDLQMLKNSIHPSPEFKQRLFSVTQDESNRFKNTKRVFGRSPFWMLVPVFAVMVFVILSGSRASDPVSPVAQNSSQAIDSTQVIDNDELINGIVASVLADQSIIDESMEEIAFLDSDKSAIDSLADSYNDDVR